MSDILVTIQDDDVYTNTLIMSKGFGIEHRSILKMIKRYKSEFEQAGVLRPSGTKRITTKKGGRPTEEVNLNEIQALYLGTLLANTEKSRKFKYQLASEFVRQRKVLMKLITQKQNAEWLEKRNSGKIERRLCTDVIQKFVQYAIDQGSKSAEKYYMALTKMENSSLFNLEYIELGIENLREALSGFALDALKMADVVVGKAIEEGMEKGMHYKNIYKFAKDRVETFAQAIGKLPIISDNSRANSIVVKRQKALPIPSP